MARSAVRLWRYILAEVAPITRQRLHVADIATTKNDSTGSTRASRTTPYRATLDPGATCRLLDECSSRGVPLESAILASLFLAAAAAAATSEQTQPIAPQVGRQALDGEGGRGGGGGRGDGSSNKPLGIRVQRAWVLGIVSVVMTLLSGSVDSKALRYFCSIYAVFAGFWAVNTLTVEVPGLMTLMATFAVIKAGEEGGEGSGNDHGPAFTPSRLAVDCRNGLWDTAARHRRESLGATALSEEAFGRFKRRARGFRKAWSACLQRLGQGLGQRHERQQLASQTSAPDAPSATAIRTMRGEPEVPFQLFGCVELEDGIDRCVSAPAAATTSAEEAVDGEGETRSAAAPAPAAARDHEPGRRALEELLIILDARYTLLYRVTECEPAESLPAESGGVQRTKDGGRGAKGSEGGGGGGIRSAHRDGFGRSDEAAAVPAGCLQESDGKSLHGGSAGGLELALVEWECRGRRVEDAGRGKDSGNRNENGVAISAWLLERAIANLLDAVPLPAMAD